MTINKKFVAIILSGLVIFCFSAAPQPAQAFSLGEFAGQVISIPQKIASWFGGLFSGVFGKKNEEPALKREDNVPSEEKKLNIEDEKYTASDWKKYNDDNLGFSFQYPAEWGDPQIKNLDTSVKIVFGDSFSISEQRYWSDEHSKGLARVKTFDEFANVDKNKKDFKQEKIVIGGVGAIKNTYIADNGNTVAQIFIARNNNIIEIDSRDLVMFDRAIPTFKFLENENANQCALHLNDTGCAKNGGNIVLQYGVFHCKCPIAENCEKACKGYSLPDVSKKDCRVADGLAPVDNGSNFCCCMNVGKNFICGDNECKYPENAANCPIDCETCKNGQCRSDKNGDWTAAVASGELMSCDKLDEKYRSSCYLAVEAQRLSPQAWQCVGAGIYEDDCYAAIAKMDAAYCDKLSNVKALYFFDEAMNAKTTYKDFCYSEVIKVKSGNTNYGNSLFAGCLKEGDGRSAGPKPVCCAGLKPLSLDKPDLFGNCKAWGEFGGVCANCGNGICGKGENKCNCPADCKATDCVKEGEIINGMDGPDYGIDYLKIGYCCAGLTPYSGANFRVENGVCVRSKYTVMGFGYRCINCGDGICNLAANEDVCSCPQDCNGSVSSCGNGKCEAGETSQNCSSDCAAIIPSENKVNSNNFSDLMMKPVIYLYPQTARKVNVKLDYQGKIIVDYPDYDPANGWNVVAYPDGRLINQADGREYSYLFWEGNSYCANYDISKGFAVKGSDTRQFLQDILAKIGLTPKEYNEFIVYWYPKMKDNPYNIIHFAAEEYTKKAKLMITPQPDSLLRVFMVYKPSPVKVEIEPQTFTPFIRQGFTAVEWGGSELK